MADPVRFWWRGAMVEVDDVPAGTSVLAWLRAHSSATGTKEGCDEGDCGACTVVLGSPDPSTGRLRLTTADSCLLLVPMLHGRAVITVEDVVGPDGLHPVQQALVDHRGTQCGFCTPGIVMSLWCEHEGGAATPGRTRGAAAPGRAALADRLAGNLCRCTGYRSVLDAAEAAVRGPATFLDGPGAGIAAALAAEAPGTALDYRAAGTVFLSPVTTDGVLAALAAEPTAVLVAGATDLVLAARTAKVALPPLVWTGRVPELRAVERTPTHLVIGAAASLEDAWAALAAEVPALEQWWHRFASPAIRAEGTLGGNIANGSPIADGTPVLLALDTELVLAGPGGERRVPIEEFHVGRRATVLRPGELVVRLEVPLASMRRDVRAWKVSRRFDSDISTVSGVFTLGLDGDVVADVRIVLGGMAATVRRAHGAEAAMRGRRWDEATLDAVVEAVADDVTPMSDHRGSDEHRLRTARGLLQRWWLQTRLDSPLPDTATTVWATP